MTMTFEELLRKYRLYEALALYDAYYERMTNLGPKRAHLGDAFPIAWVPLLFHCTYFRHLDSILGEGVLRPSEGTSYVSLTEMSVKELTRFRSLRPEPFEIAIGFPRVTLEARGLFQPAYLKHAPEAIREHFKHAPLGYVELDQDLGALHEVRIPGPLPISEAVWALTAKRNEETKNLDLPELERIKNQGLALSYWHPSHQEGMIREAVFRRVTRDARGRPLEIISAGKHYLLKKVKDVKKTINPPDGNPFTLPFPREIRSETLTDGWEGPYTKFEMADFFFNELKANFPERLGEVRPRIIM